MTALRNRTATLQVDGLDISGLRIGFDIGRTLQPEPNDAQIRVYNLSESTRKRFEQKKEVFVVLKAGYGDDQDTIFIGDVRRVYSAFESPDTVTRIEAGDGERAYKKSRINRAYRSGVTVEDIIKDLSQSMGTGIGNAIEAAKKGQFESAAKRLFGGFVLSGRSADELTKLTKSAKLEWSIQRGNLQILRRGEALSDFAIILKHDTGLIGSPTVDTEGVMKCDAMLIPGIFPGRVVDVRAELVQGRYRVEKCQYSGDTHGDNWFVTIEGKAI